MIIYISPVTNKKIMKKVILDTNFLMIPAELGVDIFTEIDKIFHDKVQFYVLEKSLKELDTVAEKGRQKEKLQVKLTKALLKTQNIKILSCDLEGSVDDILVSLAKEYSIATQDQELKRRIQHNLLSLRKRQYVIFKE
jgi:rRNA-processing protein FCF1